MRHLLSAAVLCVAIAAPVSAQTTVTMLDTGGDVGINPSIAVGPDGLALIAYYDATNGDLKTARCQDAACTAATISTIDSAGDVGRLSAIAIGTDGRGIISYSDATTPALKVAHCNDAACTSATITPIQTAAVAGRMGIAIGADGLPLIAYTVDATPTNIRTAHCLVTSCSQSTVSTPAAASTNLALAIGAHGRGLVPYETTFGAFPDTIGLGRCVDVPCTAFPPPTPEPPPPPSPEPLVGFGRAANPSIAVPPDGRPLVSFYFEWTDPTGTIVEGDVVRCTNATCTTFGMAMRITEGVAPVVAVQQNGLGWVAWTGGNGRIRLRACTNDACTAWTDSCPNVTGSQIALARAGDGRALVAFRGGGLGVAHGLSEACPSVSIADTTVTEAPGAQALFDVSLSTPAIAPVTVGYVTWDGTAVAGQDYGGTVGTLTFAPGQATAQVQVNVLLDALYDPDEYFLLRLFPPVGGLLADGEAMGHIVDGTPVLVAGPCSTIEGDAGTHGCEFPVSLSPAAGQAVTVDYATVAGTALPGSDFIAASGTLTFAPGTVTRGVSVSVIGDLEVELDQTFFVELSNANAPILQNVGAGLIVDDDAAPLSSLELTHGARVAADLAAAPGPVADVDLYRLAQDPYSSWEVVADEVSGDVAPGLVLERLAEDNSTVLQDGVPVGAGPARAMRWQRRDATPEVRQHVRVRSTSCTTGCGADDTYRLRVHETTGVIPRFNNAGSQVTVLILQNATGQFVQAFADFWRTDGTLAATVTVPIGPNAVGVVNTSTIAALAGQSGSVTVTHNGPHGALAGKAVALEPSTGFSFDSPMSSKPR